MIIIFCQQEISQKRGSLEKQNGRMKEELSGEAKAAFLGLGEIVFYFA